MFDTPLSYMKYEEKELCLDMIGKDLGYNLFDKSFEYMKYEEQEIVFNMIGKD